ncbi:NADH:flavin oxidoreductase [Rhizobium leguminosarum]|uniref:NADH:flavin oxidoreductase n=1 Tax=Rhizobium leguminosarum TaxID=384 RepID=UPI0028F425B0|nr:NADH:flavin oxidoreductase [Rhizobium leguminosarum]
MSVIRTTDHTQTPTVGADPLLQPFRLKHLVLKNRIVSTSHASMLDAGGMPLERYQRYHEEKARGGLAMTMIGGSAMTSPDSSWGGGQLDLSTDAIVPHLSAMAERIHAHGCAIMSQVSHLGRRATASTGKWLPVIAPSRVRETRTRSFPREMDQDDIRRVVRDYADAARRCREAGLDGVETVTGGHLIGQFLSPLTNHRTDSFGGSLRNRARFGLMVHDAMREAAGDHFIVGIRLVIDEGGDGGLTAEECAEIANLFEAEGHLDFFNCIYGRMDSDLLLSEHNMPGLFQKSAPFLNDVAAFRTQVKLPIIHAAGVRDVATARHALRENIVDLIGMTRAHIADPQVVNRIIRGEEEQIRPCVGASYCLNKKVHCIHNPSSGRETVLPHEIGKAPRALKVVVVGGGPSGLEAARVSAERGHDVVLLEAAAELGGQILVATAASDRRDLIGIVDWRVGQLHRLGVQVRLNTYAEQSDVLAEQPDVVIVATGGIPDTEFLEGGDLCVSVWDILTGSVPAKSEVLIYDGTGRQAATSCAIALMQKGKNVHFAMPDEMLAFETPYTDKSGFRKKFAELGIARTAEIRLVKVERAESGLRAIFRHEMTGQVSMRTAEQIVIDNGTLPVDEVFHALKDQSVNRGETNFDFLLEPDGAGSRKSGIHGFEVHRIGDAVSSRDIYSAIQDAFRLCSRI